MSSTTAPRVAWIGLGNIGRGMIKNIAQKGEYTAPLQIHNRTRARAEQLVPTLPSGSAVVAATVADAVRSADIIFLCVSNDAAVEETIKASLDAAGGSARDKLFVDCSTVHPDTTDRIAKTVRDAGGEFVACPVFGAAAMAENAQLVTVLAGPQEAVARVRPFCKGVTARAELDLTGKEAGAATRLKVTGNTFVIMMVETLSAGHVLAEKTGLGVDSLHEFIEAMFPGPFTAYSKRMLTGDYCARDEPLFAAKLARKDAGHARSLAQAAGCQLKALDVADEHLRQVVDHAGDKGDIAGIYGAVRQEAGLKFENK